eukprot:scaffold102476_cov27-Tisochrysis_lutea.AAC.2
MSFQWLGVACTVDHVKLQGARTKGRRELWLVAKSVDPWLLVSGPRNASLNLQYMCVIDSN